MNAVEIDGARLTGIVQQLVRAPSYQTERFEADPDVRRFIGETVRRETEALGLSSSNRLAAVRLAGEHPRLGRPTLTVTSIKSFPDATHTVQDEVRMVVDRRLLPGQDPAGALADIQHRVGTVPPCEVKVEPGPVTLPAEVSQDSLVVRLPEEGLRSAGLAPRHSGSQSGVDAGFFIARGIPAVMFGAGDPKLWHTDDERVPVEDLVACARALAHALLRHLATGLRHGCPGSA
jgi:acetylornithine deacetylase/succinyl-diaminopimelate desuccinylase-like protein